MKDNYELCKGCNDPGIKIDRLLPMPQWLEDLVFFFHDLEVF